MNYIEISHERCKQYGIKKDQIFSTKILEDRALEHRLLKEQHFIEIAEPFMHHLYNFVRGSGFFAILTDREGCILSIVGDEEILSNAKSYKMVPGAYMDEEHIGTNAMGTALYEQRPVQISGQEHFISAYHQWTCSGAPITDIDGKIIGTLDLTGMKSNVHPHTLGMVVAAANAIERMLQAEAYNKKLSNEMIYIETLVDSIPVAIMTCDTQGKIRSINPSVSKTLGMDDQTLGGRNMIDIMPDFDAVKKTLLQKKDIIDTEMRLNSRFNKVLFNVSGYPILNEAGGVSHMIFIIKDLKKVRKLANNIMGRRAIYTFDKLIGEDPKFTAAVAFAKKIANSRSTVLIMGESGTGKEIFAQSIQNHSNRCEEPFVAINCGAIPKNLIESELFGYEEGAFTGARKRGQTGKFEIADGGTLFLDEIGEMPLAMQTKLLRVIEESTVSRIGSNEYIPVDVRIIAATNKDLEEEVKKGNFRKDLFYRLNVLPLHLPSLRERPKDIPALIDYFMKRKSRRLNKKPVQLPAEYLDHLVDYKWPGNIRELENLVELIINTETIPAYGLHEAESLEESQVIEDVDLLSLDAVESAHIQRVLRYYQGNISLAAKCLGIGRNTLYRKLEKYHIDCSDMEHCS